MHMLSQLNNRFCRAWQACAVTLSCWDLAARDLAARLHVKVARMGHQIPQAAEKSSTSFHRALQRHCQGSPVCDGNELKYPGETVSPTRLELGHNPLSYVHHGQACKAPASRPSTVVTTVAGQPHLACQPEGPLHIPLSAMHWIGVCVADHPYLQGTKGRVRSLVDEQHPTMQVHHQVLQTRCSA